MGPQHPQPVSVHGGSNSITASYGDIVAVARRFGETAHDALAAAFALHRYLFDPALCLSAAFDPVGYAEFEAELLGALDGPRGLTWVGAGAGAIDVELRVAAAAYRAADQLYTDVHDAALGIIELPAAVLAGISTLAHTGNIVAAAEAGIARDPQLADTVVDELGVPGILAMTARALPDGHGVVCDPHLDNEGIAAKAPRGLTDVLSDLAKRDDDVHHGEIDVRILTEADGSRRAVVDITGTKSFTPLATRDITSLTTNGRAIVGERTAYEQGVLRAMHAAGVRKGDDVLLVGHSEGGLVAVNAARDADASGEFHVTHVITAGAPIGRTVGNVPAQVQVLALENRPDVVPHLDGVQNPDKPNVITVTGNHGDKTILGDHSLEESYLPVAADVQASNNASIQAFLTGARRYFTATGVETHTYQIQRR